MGRVFQSIISLHNSYNLKYIYHPWRQYDVKSYVTVYLRMRTGVNPDYDPSITDPYDNRSKKYTYTNIPYSGANGPIMAVYDSNDKMIHCTGYRNSAGNIYNSISSNFSLGQIPAGTYTVKCLSLGKGLYLGESGESVTFEVSDVDRRYDLNTGEYNKYNNYGWINYPSIDIYFLFDYEGLSFDLDVKYVSHGTDLRNVDGVQHAVYTYPSYAEAKSQFEALGYDYYYDKYMNGMGYTNNAGSVPYDMTEKYGDICTEEKYITVYEHKGFENVTERGTVDVTGVTDYSINSVGFERAFKQKGLNFSLSDNLLPRYNDTQILYNADRLDGSAMDFYYFDIDNKKILNDDPILAGSRYPAAGLRISHSRIFPKTVITTGNKGTKRVTAYTEKTYDETNNDYEYDRSTSINVNVPCLNFYGKFEYYYLAVGNKVKYEWWDYPMNGNQAGDNNTPEANIAVRVDYYNKNLKPKAMAALDTAIAAWDDSTSDYYFKKYETSGLLYQIPLDIVLGVYSGDYYKKSYHGTSHSGLDVYEDSNGKQIIELKRDQAVFGVETIDYHTSAKGSIDISGYEYCSDYSTGWFNNIVLRNSIVYLNESEIPDHQIRIN